MGVNLVSYPTGHTVEVFKNRALRRIFGPKREEMVGGKQS